MSDSAPIVIAHRGASGYVPEHTLEAKVLAVSMGAHYVEQDVVLTRDGVPLVLHDPQLDDVTDVAERFPGRRRADGRWYAIDFDLAEIRTLRAHERIDVRTGAQVFPSRFPAAAKLFRLHALADELTLIDALARQLGRPIGAYLELKAPAWHRAQGQDVTAATLAVLRTHGWLARADERLYLQCFDPDELRRLRRELGQDAKLIQLIGENAWRESTADYDAMRTHSGLAAIAQYANGIGPRIEHVLDWRDGRAIATAFAAEAKRGGLLLHPYTLRADALPAGAPDLETLHHALFDVARVDGVFSDFPDRTAQFLKRR